MSIERCTEICASLSPRDDAPRMQLALIAAFVAQAVEPNKAAVKIYQDLAANGGIVFA